MNNPKISVIVPVYNVEKYLRRCIDSILAQTFTDFELLLIDDGSKDNSGDICDGYAMKDERVRVFHKKNGGVSSARNLGLDNAKGEWVSFVDADDWVSGIYFSEGLLDTSNDLVLNKISNQEYITKNFKETKCIPSLLFSKILNKQISLGPWAKFFRRDIIEREDLRYYEDIKFAEDAIFNLQYFKLVKNISLNIEGVYHYEAPPSSAMWSKYGMTFDMLESYSEKLLSAYFDLDVRNESFEKTMLYSFVLFANSLSHNKKEFRRKKLFLRRHLMHKLEHRALSEFKMFRLVYLSNKYLPYYLDKIITSIYLKK